MVIIAYIGNRVIRVSLSKLCFLESNANSYRAIIGDLLMFTFVNSEHLQC